jgi:tetratricopeptide (TPR) repeat protein
MANWFMASARLNSLGMIVLLAAGLAAPIPKTSHAAEVCAPVLARVVSLQGTVAFRSSETEPWTDAALNDLLCADYWIRVGPSSRAALALPNDSVLRLDQQTTVRLRAQAEETRSLLELLLGTLYLFSHRPRALEIETPFVNAATEGTEFLVSVGADRTQIIVFEGLIRAQNPDGELLLASGDAAVAPAGEAPRAQVVARPRDAVAWTLYYPPILTALAERDPAPRGLPPGLQAAVDGVAANDYQGAVEALDAVPDAARDARYWTYRAGVLLNVGRVDEAAAAIQRALALDPNAGEALAQRAIIHVVQNRKAEALADARRAVELSPDSGAARIALSYALQANFQLEEARAVLREAVGRAPEDALAWARLAELEQMFGELGPARDAAERAVTLAPELARTQMVLGFAALTRIDIDQAKASFERAIALDSANPLPRLGLGLAIIRSGDLNAGGREIEIAAALDPDDSLIRSYLGKTYFEEKRGPLDAEQFAIAKELDPNDPTPWFYDAIRLQTVNRPIDALHNIQRSIELNDNRAVYRSRLLLDQDIASRSARLGRIYNDLGFQQLALVRGGRPSI